MRKVCWVFCFVLLLSGYALAGEPGGVKVDVLAKTTTSWNGDRLPAYPKGQPQITILRIVIPPGVKLPVHKHPVINGGVLLRGQLTVVTEEGQVLHMKAGDSIVEVVNKWHYGENDGNVPAEIIVFYAGVKGEPVTIIKKVQPKTH